jgi:hypothetical protein
MARRKSLCRASFLGMRATPAARQFAMVPLSVLGMARRKSLCRASCLGMRATPAASQIEMVPLSVLVSAREDAKAHAAREAQLNDARFNEAKAHAVREAQLNDARFNEVKARLDDVKARLDDVKAHAAREAQLVKDKIESMEIFNADKLTKALFEGDVARGKVTARALIEEATADVWRAWGRLDAKGREQVSPSPKGGSVTKPPSTVTEQLKALLVFPGVAAYLQVAEEDNGLARGVLAKSAVIIYPALCAPLHARAVGGKAEQLPLEVFSAIGENGRIAFAALLAFGGRNVGMYQPQVPTVPVVLRVPPMQGLSATLQQIRGSAKLPAPVTGPLEHAQLSVVSSACPLGEACSCLNP